MKKTNFHTHSTYCDGKNTIEENVISAIEKNIEVLGFSSHSFYPFSYEENMKAEKFPLYCEEIRTLQKKYEGKITLKVGFEADYVSGITFPKFKNYEAFNPDFLIGSVHYVFNKDGIIPVDYSAESLKESLEKYYKGKEGQFVLDYFEMEKEMLRCGDFTFVGHPDLVRKFNGKLCFFDENESWYKEAVKSLAREIARSGVAAEINTGGITRAKMTSPYPNEYFLSLLHEYNVPIFINSDAHSSAQLDGAFDQAYEAARKAGYREIVCDVSDRHSFLFTPLDSN